MEPKTTKNTIKKIFNGNFNKWISASFIIERLKEYKIEISFYHLRKEIQWLRERNDDNFTPFNFIIATPKGYCLTNKHDQIVKYKRNLEKRRESLTKQLTQIEKNNIYYRNF